MATHAVIWIDHKEAHVFHMLLGGDDEIAIVSPHEVHKHARGHVNVPHHPEATRHYFDAVAHAIHDVDEVLIVGPSTAKLEFARHVADHAPGVASKIIGVEAVDHPTSPQILAFARTYFKRADRLR